jgi:hypothetical protein
LGLARLSFPDGEILDRINLNLHPRGAPCWSWSRGREARVIFAAYDGRLYQLALGTPDAPRTPGGGGVPQPVPLSWETGSPGPGPDGVFVLDPFRPADPRLERHLLVSLRVSARSRSDPAPELLELWWLRLDPSETAIEDAGPMFDSGAADARPCDRRFPVLATRPDRSLVLAYLRAGPQRTSYELRVAPVQFDPETRALRAVEARERVLASDCIAFPPAFAANGRAVCCLPRSDHVRPRPLRLPVGRFPEVRAQGAPSAARESPSHTVSEGHRRHS